MTSSAKRLMRSITLTVSTLMFVANPGAHAAESINAAVTAIAKRFVDSSSAETGPKRIAVTAFVQSNGKTTQFTNLLMIALTGKIVQHGSSAFQVIERAQLQTAIDEITTVGNDVVFDKNTAQEIGNFLGVEALIVGEITTLTDAVRLDARLIDVESLSTIKEAYEWVPLTPTVQKQLSTLAIAPGLQKSDDSGTDPRNGIWRGTGTCGELTFGIAVSIVVTSDDQLSAMQTYYPLSKSREQAFDSGSLAMEGKITDAATGEFVLTPTDWLYRPGNDVALGFTGTIDTDKKRISAKYNQEGCNDVSLRQYR